MIDCLEAADLNLPSSLSESYQPATDRDIRSWSYGAVTRPRPTGDNFLDNVQGTLFDQRIFGPVREFTCACGEYAGEQCQGNVCDRCGVLVASMDTRRRRFGHIEFGLAIQHPHAPTKRLRCFPVLPGAYLQSPGAEPLLQHYDDLLSAIATPASEATERCLCALCECLIPIAQMLHEWNSQDGTIFAQGLALRLRL